MEGIPRLPDAQLARAKELIASHRKRSRCRHCWDRGYLGTNQLNMLVPCSKCVDTEAVMAAWRLHVRQTPELTELYGDYFEPEEHDEHGGGPRPSAKPSAPRA
ncbi:MAG: hypothetical protein AB1505_12745 [Candidatus Latescibacterota bacterium]